MTTGIVYYSNSGNTRTAAERLAETLNAPIVEIKEAKQGNPLQALLKMGSKLAGDPWSEIKDFDEIYLMGPIWAWNGVPAINGFLKKADLKGKKLTLITLQADPNFPGSQRAHTHYTKMIKANGGEVVACHAMHGADMNQYAGEEHLHQQVDKVFPPIN
jgi:flavodoxin